MIYEICTVIQDVLESTVQARKAGEELPSLEEERVLREAEAHETTKKLKEVESNALRAKRVEEEHAHLRLVDEELLRRDYIKQKAKGLISDAETHEGIKKLATSLTILIYINFVFSARCAAARSTTFAQNL